MAEPDQGRDRLLHRVEIAPEAVASVRAKGHFKGQVVFVTEIGARCYAECELEADAVLVKVLA